MMLSYPSAQTGRDEQNKYAFQVIYTKIFENVYRDTHTNLNLTTYIYN